MGEVTGDEAREGLARILLPLQPGANQSPSGLGGASGVVGEDTIDAYLVVVILRAIDDRNVPLVQGLAGCPEAVVDLVCDAQASAACADDHDYHGWQQRWLADALGTVWRYWMERAVGLRGAVCLRDPECLLCAMLVSGWSGGSGKV